MLWLLSIIADIAVIVINAVVIALIIRRWNK